MLDGVHLDLDGKAGRTGEAKRRDIERSTFQLGGESESTLDDVCVHAMCEG